MANDITLALFAKDVANGSKEARLALAQQLKKAGLWTGEVSSNFDMKYYETLAKLEEKLIGQRAIDKIEE